MTVACTAPEVSPGLGRRFLASLVDLLLCLVVPFFGTPPVWFVVVPLVVVAYFACFLRVGRTIGMRMASIRIVDRRTGARPSAGKAVTRSIAAVLQAAAVVVLVIFAFSDPPNSGYSAADLAAFAAASLFAVTALVAHLWMLLDHDRLTLLDRLFDLSVVNQSGLTSR